MSLDQSGTTFPLLGPNTVGANNTNRFQGAFPDPFLDYASTQMPRSIFDVLRWCEHVWLTQGVYRMACQRVVRYFLTNVELTDASDDEKEKYEEFLRDKLKIMEVLAIAGDNYMAYGNDFLSINIPFRRYLCCPKCRIEQPITEVEYTWEEWKFLSKCKNPKCKYNGEFERIDRRAIEADAIRVIHWSPHEMRLLYHPITGKTVYMWDIPGTFKHMVKTGNAVYLEHTPWEVIEAIKNDKLFRFHNDVIYHLKDETLAGVRNYGWGIPLIMSNFKQAWYIQVLKRYNEAIALDYIIPFRVITPQPGSSREADPLLHMHLASFNNRVFQMLKQHRKDPTSIHALPFPINYESLGADGQQLAPTELIDKATDEFLNSQGVPAELYRGTLQIQAMPVALRLFERTWVHLVGGFNNLINWIFARVADLQNWENLKGRLQPVTLADDLEKKQIQLQLAAGQQISRQTALAPFGINVREEIRRMLEEEEFQQEETAKFQEDQASKQELSQVMQAGTMNQLPPGMPGSGMPGQPMPQGQPGQDPNAMGAQGQPGAMPPGGQMPMGQPMGGGMGGGKGITPDDMMTQADQIARQLLTMPYESRKSQMLQLKHSNELLHSVVVQKMNKIRQQAQQVGGQQLLQQQGAQPQ